MKRAIIVILIIGAIGAGAGAVYIRRGGQEPQINTSPVTRGDITDTVGATGTLQAVTTVQVGSQVSGNISWLGADFNSIVRAGPIIAKLIRPVPGAGRNRPPTWRTRRRSFRDLVNQAYGCHHQRNRIRETRHHAGRATRRRARTIRPLRRRLDKSWDRSPTPSSRPRRPTSITRSSPRPSTAS